MKNGAPQPVPSTSSPKPPAPALPPPVKKDFKNEKPYDQLIGKLKNRKGGSDEFREKLTLTRNADTAQMERELSYHCSEYTKDNSRRSMSMRSEMYDSYPYVPGALIKQEFRLSNYSMTLLSTYYFVFKKNETEVTTFEGTVNDKQQAKDGAGSWYKSTDRKTRFIKGSRIDGSFSGMVYLIEVENNKMTYYWGEYSNHKKNGQGTLLIVNKFNREHVLYQGTWENDMKQGPFKHVYNDNKMFAEYNNDQLIGIKKEVHNNGETSYMQDESNPHHMFGINKDRTVDTFIDFNSVHHADFMVSLNDNNLSDLLLLFVKHLSVVGLKKCCEVLVPAGKFWAPLVCFANDVTLLPEVAVMPDLAKIDDNDLFTLLKNVSENLNLILKQPPKLLLAIHGMLQLLSLKLSEQDIRTDLCQVFSGIEYLGSIKNYKNVVKEQFLLPIFQRIELIYGCLGTTKAHQIIHKEVKQFREKLESIQCKKVFQQEVEEFLSSERKNREKLYSDYSGEKAPITFSFLEEKRRLMKKLKPSEEHEVVEAVGVLEFTQVASNVHVQNTKRSRKHQSRVDQRHATLTSKKIQLAKMMADIEVEEKSNRATLEKSQLYAMKHLDEKKVLEQLVMVVHAERRGRETVEVAYAAHTQQHLLQLMEEGSAHLKERMAIEDDERGGREAVIVAHGEQMQHLQQLREKALQWLSERREKRVAIAHEECCDRKTINEEWVDSTQQIERILWQERYRQQLLAIEKYEQKNKSVYTFPSFFEPKVSLKVSLNDVKTFVAGLSLLEMDAVFLFSIMKRRSLLQESFLRKVILSLVVHQFGDNVRGVNVKENQTFLFDAKQQIKAAELAAKPGIKIDEYEWWSDLKQSAEACTKHFIQSRSAVAASTSNVRPMI